MKLCECGCGANAPVAARSDPGRGIRKGEQTRFVRGHQWKGTKASAEARANMSASQRGRRHTDDTKRRISESRRGDKHPLWKGDDASYAAFHIYLVSHSPKTGVCETCEREVGCTGMSGTQYALIKGRTYSRDRDDYMELCPACHLAYDKRGFQPRVAA